jgi:hypothetical protein
MPAVLFPRCRAYAARMRSQERASQAAISRLAKKCPQCKAPVEKNGGCNHMTCQHCHFQWCWLCQGAYTDNHFAVSTGPHQMHRFLYASPSQSG